MRRYILLLLAIMCAACGFAQSPNDRYASRKTQDGTIYFINPHKLKKINGIKSFEYDVTLLTWTDSVTINFTYETDIMAIPDKFNIVSGDNTYKCGNYKPLFIDLKKNHYEIRISAMFPVSEYEKIIETPSPPRFDIYLPGKEATATYSEKSWKKEHKILNSIYSLYKYSK